MGDVSHITNMEKLFYKKWHFNADLSNWDTSHVTNMKKMFYYAFEFSQDISGWKGEAAENEQDNMFNGASRFQANFVCKDKETGPVKTCISLAAKKEHTTKQPQTLVSEDEEEQAAEEAEAEMHKHDLKKITDKTLHSAISKCLKEDPVTGNCDKFGASSGYGVMPHWDTSEVTDMKKAFFKAADLGMAARGAENNFRSSIVYPAAGALVVLATVSAYRKQQQQKLFAAETKIMANDLESQSVASASKYGTLA